MRLLRRRAAVALAAAFLAPAASAEVWQWTDAEGVVRYTPNPERVPESRRGSLVKVEPGIQAPAPSPSGPRVLYAPPEELPLEADPFAAPEPARTLEVPEAEPSAAPEPEPTLEAAEVQPRAAPELPPAPELPRVEASPPPAPRPPRSEAPTPLAPPSEEPEPPAAPREAAAPRISASNAAEPVPAQRPLSDAERARREQLEQQIAADQETLKELIGRQPTQGGEPLRESAELREIAQRLPALQAELRALDGVPERRAERAAPEP